MLGHIASSRLAERPETFFRYSVKCDREKASRIETAAKKAGLSVNAFVQRHFDAILDPALRQAQEAQGEGGAELDVVGFSRRHQVPVQAAKIWVLLRSRADADGLVRLASRTVTETLGIHGDLVRKLLNALVAAGRLEEVEPMTMGRPALYRVIGEG